MIIILNKTYMGAPGGLLGLFLLVAITVEKHHPKGSVASWPRYRTISPGCLPVQQAGGFSTTHPLAVPVPGQGLSCTQLCGEDPLRRERTSLC